MPETAEVQCPNCGTTVIVFPSTLYGIVPEHVEDEFLAHTRETVSEEGKRFAVADDVGQWTCPECGLVGFVPVVGSN